MLGKLYSTCVFLYSGIHKYTHIVKQAAIFNAFQLKLAVYLLVVSTCLAACSTSSQVQSIEDVRPDTIAFASAWHYSFDSLEAMVATSDLVIAGEVTAINEGRLMNASDLNIPTRYRLVTITIEETIKGVYTNNAVQIEEAGYTPGGVSFEIDEMPWSNVGDTGIFFLKRYSAQPEGYYAQISPEGRLLTATNDGEESEQLSFKSIVNFADSALGQSLSLIESNTILPTVKAASAKVIEEKIAADTPLWEKVSEISEARQALVMVVT